MVVLTSGVKIDALSFEQRIDACTVVRRSAVLADKESRYLLALVQPEEKASITEVRDALLSLNASLPFEKRLHAEHIFVVETLPLTPKLTLDRKKIKHMLSTSNDHGDIACIFPAPHLPSFSSPPGSTIFPRLFERVAEVVSSTLKVPLGAVTSAGASLLSLPFTSLSAVQLAKALQLEFSLSVSAAQLYSIRTVDDLCHMLGDLQKPEKARGEQNRGCDTPILSMFDSTIPPAGAEDLVITGAACRFVGGIDSLDSFWSALLAPDAFLQSIDRSRPASRWPRFSSEKNMFPSGWLGPSVTDTISSFANFFGFTLNEAEEMSVNARLVLQLGYQAIEDAGIAPHSLNGKEWGVFTSVNDSGWSLSRAAKHELQGECLASAVTD